MEIEFVVCAACGNIYMISAARTFCPVCSGEPRSLEGILAVVAPEPAPRLGEEVELEPAPPEEEPEVPKEPAPAEPTEEEVEE